MVHRWQERNVKAIALITVEEMNQDTISGEIFIRNRMYNTQTASPHNVPTEEVIVRLC